MFTGFRAPRDKIGAKKIGLLKFFTKGIITMKTKKTLATILAAVSVLTVIFCCPFTASAADTTDNYSRFTAPSNSSDYAYWNGSKMVKSKNTNTSEIKWMQAAINRAIKYDGLKAGLLDVDGKFGPASKKSTMKFQSAVGLKADGSFGPDTIKKMKNVLNDGKRTFTSSPDTSSRKFSSRTSAPSKSNSFYYSSINPFSSRYVGQCTWYAYGRAYELLGTKPKLCTGNAGNWFSYNKSNGYYQYGSTPKCGAIACWKSNGAGHVAVVEKVYSDGSFEVSHYFGSTDKSFHYSKYASGKAYKYNGSKFQGFIYIV